jgi:serpin B
MKGRKLWLVLVLVAVTAVIWFAFGRVGRDDGASPDSLTPEQARVWRAPLTLDEAAMVTADTGFALDLYARLRDREGNLFFSPFSISTALAMTYAGARGQTEAQMARVLYFGLNQPRLHAAFGGLIRALNAGASGRGYQLSVANALWGQKGEGFLKSFLEINRANYGAGLREVDFVRATEAARQTINRWVEEQTAGKIRDLLQRGVLDTATVLVLTNAIYFKGDWVLQFDKKETLTNPFMRLDGSDVQTPMMRQTAEFRYADTGDLQVLELPYVGDKLSMVILLPREMKGLPRLERSLTVENLAKWMSGLRKQKVIVDIPKFKLTSQFRLDETLQAMGMTDAFSRAADFSGMNGKKGLFIGAVVHKAFVDVNEEGTEAAAATAVVMTKGLGGPPAFVANHPFIFLIRDTRSNSILFLGRVADPTERA